MDTLVGHQAGQVLRPANLVEFLPAGEESDVYSKLGLDVVDGWVGRALYWDDRPKPS